MSFSFLVKNLLLIWNTFLTLISFLKKSFGQKHTKSTDTLMIAVPVSLYLLYRALTHTFVRTGRFCLSHQWQDVISSRPCHQFFYLFFCSALHSLSIITILTVIYIHWEKTWETSFNSNSNSSFNNRLFSRPLPILSPMVSHPLNKQLFIELLK